MKTDEIEESLEELWTMLAEQADGLELIHKELKKRDAMNIIMVKHIERLVRDRDFLLKALGWQTAASKNEVKQ